MAQMSAVPFQTRQLLELASQITPDTPEGNPTVAKNVVDAASQMMAPTMPQGGLPGIAMPGMVRQAAVGNQVRMAQDQQEQQAAMAALKRLAQQENAMRFGVAAAPGAGTIRAAKGGIVGYAGAGEAEDLMSERLRRIIAEAAQEKAAAGTTSPGPSAAPGAGGRFDEKIVEEARRRAQERAAERAAAAAVPAATAPTSPTARSGSGLMNVLRKVRGGPGMLGLLGLAPELFFTSDEDKARLEAMDARKQADINYGNESRRVAPSTTPGVTGNAPPVSPEAIAVIERQRRALSPAGAGAPGAGGPGVGAPGAGGPGVSAPGAGIMAGRPQAPAATPGAADQYFREARDALKAFETGGISPADVTKSATERKAKFDEYMRAQGVDPDQYKKDLEASEARKARKLEGIGQLEKESQVARSGTNRLIEFLSAAGGRTDPLTALGRQHGAMLTRDLSENQRFMAARERVMDTEDTIQAAIREKRRAEVTGNLKDAEAAAERERSARNEQRKAQITLATETAKIFKQSEDKFLDRQTQLQVAQLQAATQQAATRAQQEGNLEARRANLLSNLAKTEEYALAKAADTYQKQTTALGMIPGNKPTPEQQRQLATLEAEYEVARASIRNRIGETRDEIMRMGVGGGGGIGTLPGAGGTPGAGQIKVERLK
jgi:hypothetical protein